MLYRQFLTHLIKGFILSFIYFEITKANDTNIENIFLFTSFYVSMIYGAVITDINPTVITSAFLTKTVFTLIDERIKRKNKDTLSKK
jgi:hypothetical protein